MDDDDFRALIEELAGQLRSVGAEDIADERHYRRSNPETGDSVLLEPRERLIEMLRAFERLLATQDRKTYDIALDRMAGHIRGRAPRGAVVIPLAEEGRDREPVDLSRAPELSGLRSDIRILVGRLRETPEPDPVFRMEP